MKLFTQGRYATVASTAALVVALGGTSYAAGLVTSSDIKDGTIQTRDINPNSQVIVKSVRNNNGSAMGSLKNVLTMNLHQGYYLLTSKAVAESTTNGGYASCELVAPNGDVLDTSWWYGGAGYGYGTLTDQAVLRMSTIGTVQLSCYGSGSTVYDKRLTATRVASVIDLTGSDVSKTARKALTPPR